MENILIVKVGVLTLTFISLCFVCYLFSKTPMSCFDENTHVYGNMYNHSIIGNLKCISSTCLPEMCSLINTENVKSVTLERYEQPKYNGKNEIMVWICLFIFLLCNLTIKIYQIILIILKKYEVDVDEVHHELITNEFGVYEESLNIND